MEYTAYYVTHPNLGISAIVHAPSTEKARTVFLDWLERTGQILRGQRQHYRENMIAERMNEDQFVGADVTLNYGYLDASPQRFEPSIEREEMVETPLTEEFEEEERIPRRKLSPIEEASFRGFM